MRKTIIGLVASLVLSTLAFGQLKAFSTAGRSVASEYARWSVTAVNGITSGAQTIQLSQCTVGAGAESGKNFIPFAVNVPITVVDSLSETVTPTAVTLPTAGGSQSCSVTATFSNAHGAGATIISGSGGLAEAMVDIKGQGGVIVLDPSWAGTTAQISGAAISALAQANIIIEDIRSAQPQYWQMRPTAVTQIAAPAAPTVAVPAGSLSSGAYRVMVAYVDALGGISLASTDSTQTATTTGLSITSPAAATGAVGYLPYITAAGGSAGTEILAKATIDSTICTLTTLESVVPACAIGATATVTAANPSSTAKPVVESTAFSTYAYQPFSSILPPFVHNYPFGIFVASATLNNSNADAAQFQMPAGYMNQLGKGLQICVKGATATAVASSVLVLKLNVAAAYAQSPVTISTVTFATQTRAAAGTFQGCWQMQTAATGASGTFWVSNSPGNFVEFLNTTPATQVLSADASAAASSAVDLTKQLYFSVNLSETGSQNLTGPIVNSLAVSPIQY